MRVLLSGAVLAATVLVAPVIPTVDAG